MSEFSSPQPSEPAAPPPSWAPPPARERPGSLTATGVMLIVTGVLVVLVAVLLAVSGAILTSDEFRRELERQLDAALTDAAIPFLITLAVVLGAYGVTSVVAGIYVLPGRSWARITGLIVAVLGALMALLFVFSGTPFLVVGGLGFLASYVFCAWALITQTGWFGAGS